LNPSSLDLYFSDHSIFCCQVLAIMAILHWLADFP
jgi:hypothetical protein